MATDVPRGEARLGKVCSLSVKKLAWPSEATLSEAIDVYEVV